MFARLSPSIARAGAVIAAAAIAACSDAHPTAAPSGIASQARATTAQDPTDPAAPAGLVTVGASTFWPYTGEDFTGAGKDPINAIFTGYAEPLRIRAALRRLDGNRTAFGLPNVPPFNCTWKDAIGDEQTGYGESEGWTGSAVQLACGDWSLRFHVRLFAEGAVTLAGAHMDLNIPGTNEHEVISWELPEQLLTIDMIRAGILAGAPTLTGQINAAPTFREIRPLVYAGIPPQLKAIAGITAGPQLPTNGRATLFNVGVAEPIVPDVVEQQFTIQFNQFIPKPFCGGPNDFLFVQGPIVFTGVARVTPSGTYHRESTATADLTAVPVNPINGQPIGAPLHGLVTDEHLAGVTPAGMSARQHKLQQLFDGAGVLQASQDDKISAGTIGHDAVTQVVNCGQ
jgi:hypothetical protein